MKFSPSRLLPALVTVAVAALAPVSRAQVRITEVNLSAQNVELTNFGATTVNLANYWFCRRLFYTQLSGNIAPGQSRQFAGAFNATSSDFGLYSSSAFDSASAMEDFIQWGASIGFSGRENVAVAKGIWTTGSFFPVPPAGKSFHAKAQPPASGLRTGNWFSGWPHAGYPVPEMTFESIAIVGGEWRVIAKSYFLTNAHRVDVRTDLTSPWQERAAPVITELGNGRIDVRYPSAGMRQFSRLRAVF